MDGIIFPTPPIVAVASTIFGRPIGATAAQCGSCNLWFDCDSEESTKINALWHLGRVHPVEYREITGNSPTIPWLKYQEYLVREGLQ